MAQRATFRSWPGGAKIGSNACGSLSEPARHTECSHPLREDDIAAPLHRESEHSRQAIRDGIKLGFRLGVIDKRPEPRKSYLYSRLKVADMSESSAPAHQPIP